MPSSTTSFAKTARSPPPAGSATRAVVSRRTASTRRPRAIRKRSGRAWPASSSGRGRGRRVLDWKPPHAKWFVGGKLNVSVNCLDRHLRGPRRNKAAIIWEGEPGDRRTLTYFDLYRQVVDVRQRAEVARRQQGRPRRDLPAADSRAGDRDARLRAHRRRPHRRLRRLQRRVAARSHQRLAGAPARHRRRRLSPRHRSSPLKQMADEALAGTPSIEHVVVVQRGRRSRCRCTMKDGRDHW